MPLVTRELSITYGTKTIGGTSTSCFITGVHRLFKNYERAVVECDVVCRGTSEADFNTQCAALEAAFRKPNQLLKITIGSTDFLTLTHTGNTGTLGRASCEKVGHDMDSGRARMYRVAVVVQLPADLTGKDGLREAEIEVSATASGVRGYKVTGTYTALSSNDAVDQYEASFDALLDALETALTGTWRRTDHRYARDDEDKTLRFTRTAIEQLSTVLDNAALRGQRIVVTRAHVAPGDYQGVERPIELLVFYDTSVDKDSTTDLEGTWESTILPWLLSHAQAVAGASSLALIKSSPTFDTAGNRITATLELFAVAGSTFFARTVRTTDDRDEGRMIWPVWDGTPYGAEDFGGKKVHLRFVREERMRLGATFSSGGGAAGAGGGDAGGGGIFGGLGAFGIGGDALGGLAGPHQGGLGIFGIGNAGSLGNPNFGPGGGDGGGGGAANLGGQGGGGGGGADRDGFRLLRTIEDVEPRVIGLPRSNFSVTLESFVSIMRRVDPPAAAGGGGGGSSTGLTSIRGE